jgi:hypothetical protein
MGRHFGIKPTFGRATCGRGVFVASVTQLPTKIDQIMRSSAQVSAKAPFAPISITGSSSEDPRSPSALRVAGSGLVLFASLVTFGNHCSE